jgi:uncharacterized membrane protein required for colicin V production
MSALPSFTVVDIVAIALVLLGLLRGAARGLSKELAGLISVGAGVLAGWYGYRPLGDYLGRETRLEGAGAYAAAFVATLVGAYVLMRLVRLVLRSIMEFSFKGKIERVGGALTGLAKGLASAGILLFVFGLWPGGAISRHVTEDSFFGRVLHREAGPFSERLGEKYPALRLPATTGADAVPAVRDEEEDEDEPGPGAGL